MTLSSPPILLRLALGVFLVAYGVGVGTAGRSPWIILPLGLVFTVLYYLGKRAARAAWRTQGPRGLARDAIVAVLVQTGMVAVLYFIGRGTATLAEAAPVAPWSGWDAGLAILPLIVGVIGILILDRMEAAAPTVLQPVRPIDDGTTDYVMKLDPEPITPDNFYIGPFYGHTHPGQKGQSQTTPAMIAAAEARLGVQFPPLLRQLYERQNGGMVGDLYVPAKPNSGPNPSLEYDDWRGVFAHDYCYLAPLDTLRTLYDSYLDYLSEEEIAEDGSLQPNAKHYVILCQRYADTTFLDYSRPGPPRVGVVDFEGLNPRDVWFDSFEDFFKALRRGELVARG